MAQGAGDVVPGGQVGGVVDGASAIDAGQVGFPVAVEVAGHQAGQGAEDASPAGQVGGVVDGAGAIEAGQVIPTVAVEVRVDRVVSAGRIADFHRADVDRAADDAGETRAALVGGEARRLGQRVVAGVDGGTARDRQIGQGRAAIIGQGANGGADGSGQDSIIGGWIGVR